MSSLRSLCALALFLPFSLQAAEWGLDPSISGSARYDDNLYLSTAPHDTVSGIWVTPRLDFGAREQHWEIRGGAQLRGARYSQDNLNTDENSLTLKSRLLAPRDTWTLDLAHTQESLATSELVDPDTGLGQNQRERRTQTVSPGWVHSLSPQMQFVVNYQFIGVQYDDETVPTNLFDYRQDTYSLQWLQQQTARTQLSLTAFIADYGLDNTRFASQTTGIQAGFTHKFSETLDISLSLGGRRTVIDQRTIVCVQFFLGICVATAERDLHSSDTGYLLNGTLNKRFELTRLYFELADTVAPSGSGSQVESYSATLRLDRPIGSSRQGVRFLAQGLRIRNIGDNVAANDRDYYRLEPSGYWRFTDTWTLDLSYRHARQKFDNSNTTASGNAVFLSLSYKPHRIVLPN